MPYTMEDFRRDYVREHLKDLTPEELMAGLSEEDLLKGLSAEKLLEGVPLEKRLEGIPLEKLLEGVSDEELAALLKRRQGGDISLAAHCPLPEPNLVVDASGSAADNPKG
jgi:hypothetical protein